VLIHGGAIPMTLAEVAEAQLLLLRYMSRFQEERMLHTSLLLSHIGDVEQQSGAHEALREILTPNREPTLYAELLDKELELSQHILVLPSLPSRSEQRVSLCSFRSATLTAHRMYMHASMHGW
jgi:hypothetical protein